MILLTMMFVAVCCSCSLTRVFTPTITTLKTTVKIQIDTGLASPGQDTSGDTEDQHEDCVGNVRMNEDGGEVTLAGHQVADEEEGESQHSKQGQQEGQSRAGNRKVPHHLGSNSGAEVLLLQNLPNVPKGFQLRSKGSN